MRESPLTTGFVQWTQPRYEVRVRDSSYLWGSAGIAHNITFDKPLVLHIYNDPFGEEIALATQVESGTQTVIGTLQPGECVSIPVQGISGIVSSCVEQAAPSESTVWCLIKHSA